MGDSIIAEDLGFLTPEVKKLLNDSGCPGMRVMQFGFEPLGDSRELPHNYVKNCVAYLGTHDNDTIMGWFKACDPKYAAFAVDYLGLNQQEGFPFGFIRGLMTSVADLVVIQLQDVGLRASHEPARHHGLVGLAGPTHRLRSGHRGSPGLLHPHVRPGAHAEEEMT